MSEEFVILWNPSLDRDNPGRIVPISPGADNVLPDDQTHEAAALAQALEPGEVIVYKDTGTHRNGMRVFTPRIAYVI